jgi:hypothetical protein
MQKAFDYFLVTVLIAVAASLPVLAADGSIQPVYCKDASGADTQIALVQIPFYNGQGIAKSDRFLRWDSSRAAASSRQGAVVDLFKDEGFRNLSFVFNGGKETIDNTQINFCFQFPETHIWSSSAVQKTTPFRNYFSLEPKGDNWFIARLNHDYQLELNQEYPCRPPYTDCGDSMFRLSRFQIITQQINGQERSFVLGNVIVETGGPLGPTKSYYPAVSSMNLLGCQTIWGNYKTARECAMWERDIMCFDCPLPAWLQPQTSLRQTWKVDFKSRLKNRVTELRDARRK